MDKFTELVGSEITALFLKPTQETQEVLQRVVHLLDEVQTIDIPYNHCHLNGVEFGWKVRGIRDQVIALLKKSKQPYLTEWVGLTNEEIKDCLGPEAVRISPGWSMLTRAIEKALKAKNHG